MSELPPGWTETTIGEITAYVSRGKSPKYTDTSRLPVVNQKAIRWYGIQDEHLKFVHEDQFEQWTQERFIQAGDILWNSTGTGTIGRACLVRAAHLNPPKVVDSHVTIVRPSPAAIDPRFLFAWIRGPEVQNGLEELASGSTNQIELNRSTVVATRVPLAPLPEQKRIADKLDALLARVDACRARLDRVPGILKRFRQSVLAAATSGELTSEWREARGIGGESGTHSHSIGPWAVPEGWHWVTAESVCGFITKGTTPPKDRMSAGHGDVPYIKVYNLTFDGRLDFSVDPTFVDGATHRADLKRSVVLPNDVLWNIVGPPLGKVSIVPSSHPEWNINQAIARFRPSPRVTSTYLALCMMDRRTIDGAARQAKATSGQFNLTLEICRSVPIPLPSIAEQEEIGRRVDALLRVENSMGVRAARVSKLASALPPSALGKAFRGELVPQDSNDETASKLLARIQSQRASEPNRGKPARPTRGAA